MATDNEEVVDDQTDVVVDENEDEETETIFVTPDEIKVQEEQEKAKAAEKVDEAEDDLPEQYRGKSKREIIEEIARQTANGDMGAQLRDGIAALGDRIAPPPAQQAEQPFVLDAKRKAELNEKLKVALYGDDPLAALQEVIFPTVAPYFAEGAIRTVKQAREIVKLSPDTGTTFKKYEKEIDEWVNARPQNERMDPMIWERGLSEIRQKHFTDIVREEATIIAKQIAEEQVAKSKPVVSKVTVPNTDTSGRGGEATAATAKRQQRVVIKDLAKAKELAYSEGAVEMKKVKKNGKVNYEIVDQTAFLEFCEERGFKG